MPRLRYTLDDASFGTDGWLEFFNTTSTSGIPVQFRWAYRDADFGSSTGTRYPDVFQSEWQIQFTPGQAWLFYYSAVDGGRGDDVITGLDSTVAQDIQGFIAANNLHAHFAGLDLYATGADLLVGGAGNDTLYGRGGDDVLVGEDDNDKLYGGDGNDILKGDAGDDLLDGGAGEDIAVFSGPRSAYEILYLDGQIQVRDLRPDNPSTFFKSHGTDTLIGIETLRFRDGDVPAVPPAEISIAALDADKAEGDDGGAGGFTEFTFEVTRTGNTSGSHSVSYAATGVGDTPASANDFWGNAFPSGTITFAPGETTKVLAIKIYGDRNVEPHELFTVTLSNPTGGATLGSTVAVGRILNDELFDAGDNVVDFNNLTAQQKSSITYADKASINGILGLYNAGGGKDTVHLPHGDVLSLFGGEVHAWDRTHIFDPGTGDDTVYGGNGNDHIWGFSHSGGPGNNIIHGGGGTNTVHYDGSPKDFAFKPTTLDNLFAPPGNGSSYLVKVRYADGLTSPTDLIADDVQRFVFHDLDVTKELTQVNIQVLAWLEIAKPVLKLAGLIPGLLPALIGAAVAGARGVAAKDDVWQIVRDASVELLFSAVPAKALKKLYGNEKGELLSHLFGIVDAQGLTDKLRQSLNQWLDRVTDAIGALIAESGDKPDVSLKAIDISERELEKTLQEFIQDMEKDVPAWIIEEDIGLSRPEINGLAQALLPGTVFDDSNHVIVAANASGLYMLGDGNDFVDIGTAAGGAAARGGTIAAMRAADSTSGIWVDGGGGQDVLYGTDGDDVLVGGDGDDQLYGRGGNDTLIGGAGNNVIYGISGDNAILGGPGSDFIVPGPGANTIDGGDGFDVVSFLDSDTATVLDLGNPAASHNSITHVEVFYLTEHGDVFSAAGAPLPDSGVGFFIYGFAGDDTIIGSSGSDFIDPGAGANTIDGGAGGFDYLSYYTAPHGVRLDLKNPASNTGNAAGDTIRNIDAYVLTPFDDVFVGADSGQNIVFGYEGNDTFIGGFNANNWFFGGPGNDRMVGGGVQDLYALGAGASTLVPITPAPLAGSSVFGFKPGVDRIEISRAAFGLGTGYAVSAGTTFVTGTTTAQPVVATAQPAFIYYTDLGMLYFDPDGSGGTAAKLLLQFAGSPSLAAGDFVLV